MGPRPLLKAVESGRARRVARNRLRAARYARALDREDRDDIGRRPLLSLLPLGLARRARRDGGRDK